MEDDIIAALDGWTRCSVCGHLHRRAWSLLFPFQREGLAPLTGRKVCQSACCEQSSAPVNVRHCSDCRGTGSFRDQIDEDRPWATHGCGSCGGKGVVVA